MSEQEIKQTEEAPPQPKFKKKKLAYVKPYVWEVRSFLYLFCLCGNALFDVGQQSLIQLVDKLLDDLSIEHMEGGLQQGLVLHNIRYQTAGIDTQIAQARLQLDLVVYFLAKFVWKILPYNLLIF
ncbi:Uncharacterised protein [Rodentibacter pneumotropicus]|uniref:Uncharacterized protein n=1 Tax=Rodentibacter pneumotropicus TaxID=758 RepID=A0A3S4TSZ5_9PAST|nr:Uncharacterised protein [Rodentibacter pneumotropicus]